MSYYPVIGRSSFEQKSKVSDYTMDGSHIQTLIVLTETDQQLKPFFNQMVPLVAFITLPFITHLLHLLHIYYTFITHLLKYQAKKQPKFSMYKSLLN